MNTQPTTRLIESAVLSAQTTVLPKDATMKGDMRATQDMSIRLDGEYEGSIEMQTGGTVHITAGSVVTTQKVTADFIYVEGTVKGDLHARKGIELSPTARIKGCVRYDKDLDMHPGARVSGQFSGPEFDL